ncbi:MAG: hypothetical protein L0H59_01205 [Tomitella sp.]|nr:hypothetical protein [Tomitella sp.]
MTDRGSSGARFIRVADETARSDLRVFVERAARLDASALVRIVERPGGGAVWTSITGFDTLVGRTFRLDMAPADICVAADGLASALGAAQGDVTVDPGLPMDTAWRGTLPPADGFEHVDDVPARELVALSAQGADVARENSTMTGPPRSLLDQIVLEVSGGGHNVEVPLRSVFALTAMGFVPDAAQEPITGTVDVRRISADEPVRVRATRTWVRLDARYGSVALRVGGDIPLMVT